VVLSAYRNCGNKKNGGENKRLWEAPTEDHVPSITGSIRLASLFFTFPTGMPIAILR
jgi:hypothetical protein